MLLPSQFACYNGDADGYQYQVIRHREGHAHCTKHHGTNEISDDSSIIIMSCVVCKDFVVLIAHGCIHSLASLEHTFTRAKLPNIVEEI